MTQSANSIEARSADKTALGERANTQETKKRSRADVIAPWRWPKGFCPNPTGRPKHDRAAEIARQVFEDNPDAVYNAMALFPVTAVRFGRNVILETVFWWRLPARQSPPSS
jgi:hypothetical protein